MLDAEDMPSPEILAALPVFPLPNVVFFPGMVLPLNVFESKYLELVDHVLDGGGHIGVPLLVRPDETTSAKDIRPAFERVFGVGRLVSHHRMPDGRRLIRLKGLGRVKEIHELLPSHEFREVAVELLPENHGFDRGRYDLLVAQVERIAAIFCPDEKELVDLVVRIDDPRLATYALTALLPNVEVLRGLEASGCPTASQRSTLCFQQQCLEAETLEARVSLLLRRTERWLHQLGAGGFFPKTLLH